MVGSGSELSPGTIALADRGEGATVAASQRLLSLDVFRGLTIASMMLVNNAGGFDQVYGPLKHAAWHGWTFTDTVFPFFLWIAGVSMTFSFAKRVEAGADRTRLLWHALRRGLIIFVLGLFLNGFPFFNLATLRIPGVLQRIGVCYFCAALVFLYCSRRMQAWVTAACLLVYWALMTLAPVPGVASGVLEKGQNFAAYIDSLVLSGHMWSATKTWDPEGILSTIPAISTTLFGVLTGHLLRSSLSALEKAAWMFSSGSILLFLGAWWDKVFPINKNIWTSSYTVFMAGMALVVFGCCYFFLDVKGWKKHTHWLAIYGSNAIAVYVIAGVVARMLGLLKLRTPVYEGFAAVVSPINASLLYGLSHVLLLYLLAWFLYRRGWFLKI